MDELARQLGLALEIAPESPQFASETARGIDKDHLAVDAEQHEPSRGAGQQPDLVAIAVVRLCLTRREMGVGRTHSSRVNQPLSWNHLAPVPCRPRQGAAEPAP